MNFYGYLMCGNDNYVSTTDRGADTYYRRIPVDWGCTGSKSYDVKVYNESAIKVRAHYNSTTYNYTQVINITSNITTNPTGVEQGLEIELLAGADDCIGNPDFSYPISICVNTSNNAEYSDIRPSNYIEKFTSPDFLDARKIYKDDCYVLPTGALCDNARYRFTFLIDYATGQQPNEEDYIHLFILDKTWFKNDAETWESGFGFDTNLGTDTDVGIDTISAARRIDFTTI